MFKSLTQRLNGVIKNLSGQGRLTESNIKDTMREIRIALLEADVALPVARAFIEDIETKALGTAVMGSLTPGQELVGLVQKELTTLMGESNESLNLRTTPPAVILMAGLQGSGKTTTAAKLARWLITSQKKSVMVASADVYRPAAIEQLKTLAATVGAEFFPSAPDQDPVTIATSAITAARTKALDVVIIDTAGRLDIDQEMMDEIKRIHAAIHPVETLFVVDSMTGQIAANTAKAFDEAVPLTGVILTKADGDTRGGAALSIRYVTGKPIKFIGMGEKVEALEPFHPDRIASRILDMGDIVSLVEQVHDKIDHEKAEKLAHKLKKGKSFDFTDFLSQLEQIQNMGGMMGIMSKLPGINQLPANLQSKVNDKKLVHIKAIIYSMTPRERRFPDVIKSSHKRRIATGAGRTVQEVNQLLRQFDMMKKMIGKMAKGGGLMKMMRGMQGKFPFGGGGGMPPGLLK